MVRHNTNHRPGGRPVETDTSQRGDRFGGVEEKIRLSEVGQAPEDTDGVHHAYWRSLLMAGLGLPAGFPPAAIHSRK